MVFCENRGPQALLRGLSQQRFPSIVLVTLLALLIGLEAVPVSAGVSTGVWTPLKNKFPLGSAFQQGDSLEMYVMTDGTVMVHANDQINGGYAWCKLVPDSSGNYINGTWTKTAPMVHSRDDFSAVVLPNGKLMVLGTLGQPNGEIYDPVKDSWTPITYPGTWTFGDAITLLPNGKVLVGDQFTSSTYLFDPSTNTWTQTGTKNYDSSQGDQYVLLPNGDVLTVSFDVAFAPFPPGGFYQKTERYDYRTGLWTDAGVAPAWIRESIVSGPPTLLPNGQVYWPGDANTVFYAPTSNSWTLGPNPPATVTSLSNNVITMAGVMVPDGHYLQIALGHSLSSDMRLVDYDYSTNTITDVTSTLPAALLTQLNSFPSPGPTLRTVVLPNGHILLNCDEGTIWDYGPSTAPQKAWRPTIAKITGGTGNNPVYTLTGTQLTGLWQGASTPDVAESSNYPIISLTGPGTSKNVAYATTTDWTPGVATGTTTSTVNFTLPTGIKSGTYQLAVIANGIASASSTFNYNLAPPTPNYVQAKFVLGTPSTLTLTGDTSNNAVSITQQGTLVNVSGSGLTRIGTNVTSNQTASFNVPGDLVIVCNFNQPTTPPNSDAIFLVAVQSSSTSITFGAGEGSNQVNVTYCNIGNLTVNGGAHTKGSPNVLTIVGSKINSHTYTNIP